MHVCMCLCVRACVWSIFVMSELTQLIQNSVKKEREREKLTVQADVDTVDPRITADLWLQLSELSSSPDQSSNFN